MYDIITFVKDKHIILLAKFSNSLICTTYLADGFLVQKIKLKVLKNNQLNDKDKRYETPHDGKT